MSKLSQSDLTLTIAFVLADAQRSLTAKDIQTALTESDYDVSAEETIRALNDGPFHPRDGKWELGRT